MRGTLQAKGRHVKHRSLREMEQRIRSVRRSAALSYMTPRFGVPLLLPWPFGFVRISTEWLEFGFLFKVIYRVPRSSVTKIFRNPMVLPTDRNIRFDFRGKAYPKDIVLAVKSPARLIELLRLKGWSVSHR